MPRRADVALAAFGLVLAIAVGEIGVRLLAGRLPGGDGPAPTGYAPVNTSRPERQLLNARGYRDRERSSEPAPGVRRVLVLGDSFAWGHGVERDDAFPARLERALAERHGDAWEVVNLAKPGMNTVDQAALLETEGWSYAPEVVLVAYVLNDSEDAEAAETRRAAEWRDGPAPSILDASALARLVRWRLWATAENRRRVEGYRSMYAPDAPGWRAGQQALERIGAACRVHGVPWIVAVFPLFGNPLDDSYPFVALHDEVARAASAAGARVEDLLPTFRGLRSEALVVDGTDDEHPNEVAHRLATGAIRRAIEEVVPATASHDDGLPSS